MNMDLIFLVALFIIAFLYSSVGHGGASGYLALMVLFGIAPVFMKSTALTLNLFVSAIAFFSFFKAGYFRWKILLPFAITSVPLAYLGAKIHIDTSLYKIILGVCLLIAVGRILYTPKGKSMTDIVKASPLISVFVGGVLGFFSGMIGIGGGIILSPLLLLLRWATIKETAAISAAFIFLNSASGLIGSWHSQDINTKIFLWVAVGIAGGLSGSYFGSAKFNTVYLKYILSGVILIACVKLFLT